MERKTLGRTALCVSRMGLGGGGPSRLGQQTGGDARQATRLVGEAFDAGVNFFDTSEAYGTEKLLGDAIRGLPRDEIVVSTKGMPTQDGALIDGTGLERKVDASLGRLGTETIDLYLLHGLLPQFYDLASEVLVPALIRLRESGKIRYFGVSEAYGQDPDHRMLGRAAFDAWWDVFFVGYNALDPGARRLVLPRAAELGIGCVGIFALSDRLRSREAARKTALDAASRGILRTGRLDLDHPLAALCRVDSQAGDAADETHETDAISAAYRFALSEPGLQSVLVGTGNADHLRSNLNAARRGPLAHEHVAPVYARYRPPRLGKESGARTVPLGEAEKAQYRSLGYVTLSSVIDPATLESVQEETDRLLRRPWTQSEENLRVEYRMAECGEKLLTKFDPATDLSSLLDALAHDPRILEPVRALLGEEPVLLKDKLIYKPPGHPGFGCHQDLANWTPFSSDTLTVFVAIDDAPLEAGPVEVYPGLHTQGLVLAGGEFRASRQSDTPTAAAPLPLPLAPGDLLIFSSLLPHQSAPNRTPSLRRSLLLTYSRSSLADCYSGYYAHYLEQRGGRSSHGPARYFEPPVRALDEPSAAPVVTGHEPSRLGAVPPAPGSCRVPPAPVRPASTSRARRGLDRIRVWRKLRRRLARLSARPPQRP